jgi:hypothetical protein
VFVKKLSPRQWAGWGSELPLIARMDYLTTARSAFTRRRLRSARSKCASSYQKTGWPRNPTGHPGDIAGHPGGISDQRKFLRASSQGPIADQM